MGGGIGDEILGWKLLYYSDSRSDMLRVAILINDVGRVGA